MKKTLLAIAFCFSMGLINEAQAQATSAKNEIDKNGKQCSSTGIGKDKASAEQNREKALTGAKEKGNDSFSGKDGGGAAVCKEKETKEKTDNPKK